MNKETASRGWCFYTAVQVRLSKTSAYLWMLAVFQQMPPCPPREIEREEVTHSWIEHFYIVIWNCKYCRKPGNERNLDKHAMRLIHMEGDHFTYRALDSPQHAFEATVAANTSTASLRERERRRIVGRKARRRVLYTWTFRCVFRPAVCALFLDSSPSYINVLLWNRKNVCFTRFEKSFCYESGLLPLTFIEEPI